MKKVKLMLLSLSVLAVVGGTLAFSAKTGTTFCTALPVSGACPTDCPNTGQLTNPVLSTDFVCTAQTITGGFDQCHPRENVSVGCVSSIHKTLETN